MSPDNSRLTPRTYPHDEPAFALSGPGQARDEESLRDLVRVMRKRKFVILATTLGALAIGLLVCFVMRPQYVSTATLLVNKDDSAGLDLGSLSSLASAVGGSDDVKTELQTHADVLQGDSNVLSVIRELNLQSVRPYKYSPGLFGTAKMKAEQGLPLENAPATRERLLKIFSTRLKVEPAQDSRLIGISYRDYDPDRAAAIANALVDSYIRQYLQARYQATAKASDWLSSQLNDLRSNVEDSQRKLSDYERQTGLSVLTLGLSSGDSSSGSGGSGSSGGIHIPAVDKLAALNLELTTAEGDRIAKEAIYRLTQTQSPEVVLGLGSSDLSSVGGGSAVVSQGNGLQVLQGLRAQEAAVKMSYADAASKYGAQNPRLTEIQSQVAALDTQIHEELLRINQRAQNDYTLAQKTEEGIRNQYTQQQEVVNKLNDSTIQLEILAGEAMSSRALYEGLHAKLQEAGVEAGVKATNLDLVDPARPSATPIRPNWLTYPSIALAAGLLLGVGGAFVWENFDDTLLTPEQVEKVSLFPVLSYIPLLRAEDSIPLIASGSAAVDPSYLLSRPNAEIAESYRALRTSIQLSTVTTRLQVLLVTSPLGSDGKTTVCYNLAIAFAQQGNRVLLIDADMRKPRMHHLFRFRKSPGLSEVLAGRVTLQEAVRTHETVPGLSIVPAGTTPPNPAELLGSPRLDELIARTRNDYDLVIIDSPPALLVTDSVVLTAKVDGTILVIRSGVTTRPSLTRVSELLQRSRGRKLGIILNGVDTRSSEYYYAYGYYGDKGYYEEEEKG